MIVMVKQWPLERGNVVVLLCVCAVILALGRGGEARVLKCKWSCPEIIFCVNLGFGES